MFISLRILVDWWYCTHVILFMYLSDPAFVLMSSYFCVNVIYMLIVCLHIWTCMLECWWLCQLQSVFVNTSMANKKKTLYLLSFHISFISIFFFLCSSNCFYFSCLDLFSIFNFSYVSSNSKHFFSIHWQGILYVFFCCLSFLLFLLFSFKFLFLILFIFYLLCLCPWRVLEALYVC